MIQINVKIKKDPTCLSQQELSELVKKQIETHPLRIDGSSITVESTPSPNDSQQTVNSNNLVEDNLKHLSPHSCHCYSHTQPLDFSFPTLVCMKIIMLVTVIFFFFPFFPFSFLKPTL